MDTTKRTVAHALFDYTRTRTVSRWVDGQAQQIDEPYLATALRGEVIEVNDTDLERGERLGALVEGELPTAASPAPAPPQTPDVSGGGDPTAPAGTELDVDPSVAVHQGGNDVPARPKTVAQKHVWVDYAVARGMPREEAEDLTKEQIIEKYPAE